MKYIVRLLGMLLIVLNVKAAYGSVHDAWSDWISDRYIDEQGNNESEEIAENEDGATSDSEASETE